MKTVKLKILEKKPFAYTDRSWFPYREIVDTDMFDNVFCQEIDDEIENYGIRNVLVYYKIAKVDTNNRPLKILVGYRVKKTREGQDCVFNTVYDKNPLGFRCYISDNTVTPDEAFYYKRFITDSESDLEEK